MNATPLRVLERGGNMPTWRRCSKWRTYSTSPPPRSCSIRGASGVPLSSHRLRYEWPPMRVALSCAPKARQLQRGKLSPPPRVGAYARIANPVRLIICSDGSREPLPARVWAQPWLTTSTTLVYSYRHARANSKLSRPGEASPLRYKGVGHECFTRFLLVCKGRTPQSRNGPSPFVRKYAIPRRASRPSRSGSCGVTELRYDVSVARIPKALFHYTDNAGLLGIVTNHTLWLGDTRFVNDRAEYKYGMSRIHDMLSSMEESQADDLISATRNIFFAAIARRRNAIYASSMSESDDSISQWQRYGADGHGYCIALDTAALVRELVVEDRRPIIRRMLYTARAQHQAVRRRVDEFCRRERTLRSEERDASDDWQASRRFSLAGHLADVAVELKNPSFEDEREWRFILSVTGEDRERYVRFYARGAYLRPYTEATCKTDSGRLPIFKIVCARSLTALWR